MLIDTDKKIKLPQSDSFPELEAKALAFWKENKIFEKSVENAPKDNLYVFYDGPPFISGLPHYGHLLGSIAKDVIPRYWTMKGKRVERVWGWDAHGLTVENKVQKKLGIKNKRDIEKFGLEKFIQECYKYTSEVSAEWEWYIDRIGRWVDFKNAYKTIDQNYMESEIWAFKQLYDKGLIYEGIRTSLFCTTCGTPVSNFEVAMDNTYKDMEDPSVTVKFPVTSKGEFEGASVLAWTTTPWTVPSNRGLTLDGNKNYILVELEGEKFILAKERLESVFEGKKYKKINEFKGSKLVGLEYKPPYKFFASGKADFKVYSYEQMVNMEEGTGIVHSAPGFGDVDTAMGKHYNLTLMLSIDDEGKFIPGNNGKNPFEGLYYAKANDLIINDLLDRNLLFSNLRIVHRFPYHDRCETPLIQKAQNSWFINVAKLKKDMIILNENINWIPSHLKHGRFVQGIEQAPDWCISRNRFWGTPMPIWESEDGAKDRIVISSIKELEDLSGQKITDLHRPYIDNVEIKKDGKVYKRRLEVLDSWVGAGSMPYAQIHYPFENTEKFEKNFPGDYIVEYIGQVRAWFYVTHVLSTALFGKNAFKNVISTGVMSGNDGRKMSKTYGNYTDPREVLETVGGDALRLYLMSSPLMVGDNSNFDLVELKNKSKSVLNPLWNSVKFFEIYANLYNFDPSWEINLEKSPIDKWIVVRLNETIKQVSENIENYLVPPAVKSIEEFVDDLSRWYVRRSRDRISSGDKNALAVLYHVLTTFSKVSAPIIPFISENIYKNLVLRFGLNQIESVHLCTFPKSDKNLLKSSSTIIEKMKKTREIVTQALSMRAEKSVGVRQPLSTLEIPDIDIFEDLIKEEVNVKSITKAKGGKTKIRLDFKLTKELELEGKLREFIRKVQDLRKKAGYGVSDVIEVEFIESEIGEVIKKYTDEIKSKVNARSLRAGGQYGIKKV